MKRLKILTAIDAAVPNQSRKDVRGKCTVQNPRPKKVPCKKHITNVGWVS